MAVLLAGMAFLTTFVLILALTGMAGQGNPLTKRVVKVLEADTFGVMEVAAVSEKRGVPGFLSRIGRLFSGGFTEKLDQDLRRADIPLRGGEFLALMILVAAGLGVLGFLSGPLQGIVSALIGFIIPKLHLSAKMKKRLSQFEQQIGDSLVMMSNALKAGYSFLQAMEMVAQEMSGPISKEFAVCLKETSLGVNVESSLAAMANRVGSDDFDLVTTAVLIQRQVGGNLSEILDIISETIRERVRIKGEIRTLTAQGRISGLIIGTLPFAIAGFLMVTNRSYLSLLVTHPLGIAMLVWAGVSEIIGALLIRKIIQIEV